MRHIGLWIAPRNAAETTVETVRGLKAAASNAASVATSRETAEVEAAEMPAEMPAEIVAAVVPTIPVAEVTLTTPADVVVNVEEATVAQPAAITDAAQAAPTPLMIAGEVVVPEAALMTAGVEADLPSVKELVTQEALPAVATVLPTRGEAPAPTDLALLAPEALLDVSEDQAMPHPPEATPQHVTTTGQ